MIWNGYSMTKERQAKVAFTIPYMKNEQVIVVKNHLELLTLLI